MSLEDMLAIISWDFCETYILTYFTEESSLFSTSLTQFSKFWGLYREGLLFAGNNATAESPLSGRQPTQNMPTGLHSERFGFTWEQ